MMGYDYFIRAVFSLVLATVLAAAARRGDALTRGGLILAWCLAVAIAFCGGLAGFLALAAVFVCTVLAGRISQAVRKPIEANLHAKAGRRDAVQICCNVCTGAAMLLLRAATGQPCFLWAYGGAMAASLADSLASELGVLSKAEPRDILTRKRAEKGLSGAVSPLGLISSLAGAAIVAAICAALWDEGSVSMFCSVTFSGFLAALCDSVLGSAVQVKYRCPDCGALTERPMHCGEDCAVERGVPWVDNDVVNLCNNLIGAAVAILLFFLMK